MMKKYIVFSLGIVFIILIFAFSANQSIELSNSIEVSGIVKAEFLSNDYFDEIEELFDRVKTSNDKWYVLDGSKKIAAKAVVNQMMDDLESNPSALTDHENFIRFFDTFDRNIRKVDSITERMHFFRNTLNSYSNAPEKLDDMINLAAKEKWKLFSAKFHRYNYGENNGALNVKFLSEDGRFEAVYNVGAGKIVDDPVNMGTYNYAPGSVNPIKFYLHGKFDKDPWKKWGNVKEVPYHYIDNLESKHGSAEAKNNEKDVERWIQLRKDALRAEN